jgi:peptide chain release factor 3
MAYVRVVSGKFVKGMKCSHARTGRVLTLANAAMLFGSGRDGVEEAFPGDIIGLNNPSGGLFQIGDALYSGGSKIVFEAIPSFSPECFGYLRPTEVGSNRKSFQKGVDQLLAEGAVQRLKARGDGDGDAPLLAAVGSF